jgi:hypothetical protein
MTPSTIERSSKEERFSDAVQRSPEAAMRRVDLATGTIRRKNISSVISENFGPMAKAIPKRPRLAFRHPFPNAADHTGHMPRMAIGNVG